MELLPGYSTPNFHILSVYNTANVLDLTLFLQFSSTWLKPGGQLDNEVMQGILFRGYTTPNFHRVITLKIIQTGFHFQLTPPIVFIWSSDYLYLIG